MATARVVMAGQTGIATLFSKSDLGSPILPTYLPWDLEILEIPTKSAIIDMCNVAFRSVSWVRTSGQIYIKGFMDTTINPYQDRSSGGQPGQLGKSNPWIK